MSVSHAIDTHLCDPLHRFGPVRYTYTEDPDGNARSDSDISFEFVLTGCRSTNATRRFVCSRFAVSVVSFSAADTLICVEDGAVNAEQGRSTYTNIILETLRTQC